MSGSRITSYNVCYTKLLRKIIRSFRGYIKKVKLGGNKMRTATISRKTKETDIQLSLNLDGTGKNSISTGIGFFDHMLTAFSVHSGIDLDLKVIGDLQVDGHHTVEDTGIVLGQAFAKSIDDKSGIARKSPSIISAILFVFVTTTSNAFSSPKYLNSSNISLVVLKYNSYNFV